MDALLGARYLRAMGTVDAQTEARLVGRTPAASLRLALAQAAPIRGEVDANARAAAATVAHAADQGAHLVVFPEMFLTGYELEYLAATPSAWLEENDARLDPVRLACAAHGVTAVLGAAHRTPAGDHVIGAPVVGPSGDLTISMKEHVHGSEQGLFVPGAGSPPFEVHGWRVAIGICFDAALPGHAERAARDGIDLYVVSALYTLGEERRSDLHLGARAMDNRVFSGLANYAGTTGGHASCGLSGAWGPGGEVLERAASTGPALVLADLEPSKLAAHRRA